jgi:hypothetical protein
MFSSETYKTMYARFMGPLARPISILVNDNGTYIGYPMTAHVSKYSEIDMIPGSSIQMGDLRVIVLWENLTAVGIDDLELKDRINIDGKTYSIVEFDKYSRSVGENTIAAEIAVRGGGLSVIASVSVYRIVDNGDYRVTGDGDRRIVKEAV